MAKGDDSTRIFGGLKAPMSPFRLDPGLREPIRHKLDGGLKSFMDAFQQPLASDLKGPIRAAKDVGNLNTFAALRNGLDAFSPDRHKKIRNPSPLEDKEHLKEAIRQNGPAALFTPPPPPVIVVPVEQVIKALALAQSVSPDPAPRSTPAAKRKATTKAKQEREETERTKWALEPTIKLLRAFRRDRLRSGKPDILEQPRVDKAMLRDYERWRKKKSDRSEIKRTTFQRAFEELKRLQR